jgi:hypothetical protein
LIASYFLARQEHDWAGAMQALARLEADEYSNEADWEEILAFCREYNFDARLEIVTRRLIKSGSFASYKPYFVLAELLLKSGFKDEARGIADEYKTLSGRLPAPSWDFVSLLFSVDDFSGCLQEVRSIIEQDAAAFPFLIMEAKALLALGEQKMARVKLKALASLATRDPGNLVWFSYVAMELGEHELLKTSLARLVQMIAAGSARLTEGAVHVLQRCRYLVEVETLVRSAQPKIYDNLEEIVYVFELARARGAYATALRFGHAILQAAPDHGLKGEIEKVINSKGFMMS